VTANTRRTASLVAVLLVVLAIALYLRWRGAADPVAAAPTPATGAAPPSNQTSPGGARQDMPVTDVRLEALKREGTLLGGSERNPFRFRAKAEPAAPARALPPPPPQTFVPPVETGPPPPPPIPLRYVGLLGAVTQPDRIAVLSDARGNPFYGKEGDIIEGRYRVLRIAGDSVDVAYADGRGRQTLRLSTQ